MSRVHIKLSASTAAPPSGVIALYSNASNYQLYTKNSAGTQKIVAYQDWVTALGYQTVSGTVATASTNFGSILSVSGGSVLCNSDVLFFRPGGSGVWIGSTSLIISAAGSASGGSDVQTFGGPLKPIYDNTYTLGTAANRWTTVYATTGAINTSDQRLKKNITPLDNTLGLDFLNSLTPVSYKWIEGGKDKVDLPEEVEESWLDAKGNAITTNSKFKYTSRAGKRTHLGLIAQDVKQAIDTIGLDFAGWVLDDPLDQNSTQSLRYDQFIAPLIKAVQELSQQNKNLQQQIDDLKQVVANPPQ